MNKLVKPIAFLFAVALSTGAFAQQGDAGKQVKKKVGARELSGKQIQVSSNVKTSADQQAKSAKFTPDEMQLMIKDIISQKGIRSVALK